MPTFACLDCGTPSNEKRCPQHRGTHTGRSRHRDRKAQHLFRQLLLARAGGQCEETDETTGQRCVETTDLRACHLIGLADHGTYDLSNGKLRCKRHDMFTDPYAR